MPAASSSRKRPAQQCEDAAGDNSNDGVTPECPICLSRMSLPKVLHCGHTICNDCVTRLTTRRAVATGGFGRLRGGFGNAGGFGGGGFGGGRSPWDTEDDDEDDVGVSGFGNSGGLTLACPICKQVTTTQGTEVSTNFALRGEEIEIG